MFIILLLGLIMPLIFWDLDTLRGNDGMNIINYVIGQMYNIQCL